MKALQSVWEKIKGVVGSMSKTMKIIIVAALVFVIIFSVSMAVVMNRVEYTALYSGLSASEAGEIMTLLEEQGVDAKTQGTDTILVPEKVADKLRISLASQGYPKTGLNYNLFTEGSGFGSTDVETQTRLQYTLQENIRTTINCMDKVKDSIVIVNMATNSSYVSSSNRTEASAAVMIEAERNQTLTVQDARSIAEFVVKSVPSLRLENVSIVDSNMQTYDVLNVDTSAGANGESTADEYSTVQRVLIEDMKAVLEKQVLRVLEPALGKGNVAASVNLSLNFDDESVSSVKFAPPVEGMTSGLVRSSETLRDSVRDLGDGQPYDSVGTDSNGVSATEYVYDEENGGAARSESISEIYNYELDEVRTQIEKAKGAVTDLSVAVLLNSAIADSDSVIKSVKNLVANAIGVSANYVSVEALPFVQSAVDEDLSFADYLQLSQDGMRRSSRNQLLITLFICVAALGAVLMVLLFVRKLLAPPAPEPALEGAPGGLVDITLGDEGEGEEDRKMTTAEEVNQALLESLYTKSEITEKVEQLIEADTEATVQLLKSWLNDV